MNLSRDPLPPDLLPLEEVAARDQRPRLHGDIAASIPAGERAHLVALGAAVPVSVLSDDAYVALLHLASACGDDGCPRLIVDAYQHATGEWVVEVHAPRGVPVDPRFSPAGWTIFVERYLAAWVRNGFMPLADIWCAVCHELARTRTGSLLLAEQWADATAREGEVRP